MIDVHIAHHHEPAAMRRACRASLVDEPIYVHDVAGVAGNVNQARLAGFGRGRAAYVSFVDPDDRIAPGTYQRARAALAATDATLWISGERFMTASGELAETAGGTTRQRSFADVAEWPRMSHGVRVWQRAFVDAHRHVLAALPGLGDFVLTALAFKHGAVIQDPEPLRYWRRHAGQVSADPRQRTPDLLAHAHDLIRAG